MSENEKKESQAMPESATSDTPDVQLQPAGTVLVEETLEGPTTEELLKRIEDLTARITIADLARKTAEQLAEAHKQELEEKTGQFERSTVSLRADFSRAKQNLLDKIQSLKKAGAESFEKTALLTEQHRRLVNAATEAGVLGFLNGTTDLPPALENTAYFPTLLASFLEKEKVKLDQKRYSVAEIHAHTKAKNKPVNCDCIACELLKQTAAKDAELQEKEKELNKVKIELSTIKATIRCVPQKKQKPKQS